MALLTRRRTAALAAAVLLLAACGNGEEAVEEPTEEPTAEAAEEPEPEEPEPEEPDPAARGALYYGGSELFLPEHPVEDFTVDFYASLDDVAEISAWFSRNIDDFDTFTVEEETVEGEARWVIHRDAAAGELARIEIAHSTAHADIGLIEPISETLPADTIIIAVAFAT